MSARLMLIAAAIVSGCVTAPAPRPTTSAEEAFAPPVRHARSNHSAGAAVRGVDEAPEGWARQFRMAAECDFAARRLIEASGRALAWTYMKACAQRPDFGMLQSLVVNWPNELKTRPEAAGIVAQVVANRGGLVEADVKLLQQHRLPLFELNAALAQPQAFKGRYLLLVGRIERVNSSKKRSELVLMGLSREDTESAVFAAGSLWGSTSSRYGRGSGRYESSNGSGRISGEYSGGASSMSGRVEMRSDSVFKDTNQTIMARIARPDPFLAVDRSFVFLVRFDGSRQTEDESDEEGESTALVSVISYHEIGSAGSVSW